MSLSSFLQIKTISTSCFKVDTPAAVANGVKERGVALLHLPNLKEAVSPEDIKHAKAFASHAVAIFEGPLLDENGGYVDEVDDDGNTTGYLESDYGTQQRRQRQIGDDDDVLTDLRGGLGSRAGISRHYL